jgi:hypothetical protein
MARFGVSDSPADRPLPEVAQNVMEGAGYNAPGQDATRRHYHEWYRAAGVSAKESDDVGGEGLKVVQGRR